MKKKCKYCQIICLIRQIEASGKPIPCSVLKALANAKCKKKEENSSPVSSTPVIGPYLQIIPDVLYPPNGEALFKDFSLNIQYYNQGDYYTTYEHLISDETGGPYGMPQASSVKAIQNFFSSKYGNVPEIVKNSVVIGKPLTEDAASNGFVDLGTLKDWVNMAQSSNINVGGLMFWSAGFYDDDYPSDKLFTETFSSLQGPHKVMYIGAGPTGQVHTADGSTVYAQGSDPDGSAARKVLMSYAETGYTELILAFWNYTANSDWIIDWTSINKDAQKQLMDDIHAQNPNCKVLVSAGGAYGNVGPNSGVSGTDWGKALAQYAVDNNLDGVDLDLEGAMLGTQWSSEQYQWLKDAVNGIASVSKDLMVSFAPVGPLCANPN